MTDTPETDQAERESIAAYIEAYGPDAVFPCDGYDHARKLERERDEWQINALLKLAVKQLACMWCGEIVHAPTGYEPGTPLSEEQRGQAYREHVATCQKHPVRDVERERDELAERLDFQEKLNRECIDQITDRANEREEIRAQLREEQQLHVQTLNERDEARQWESQALVARIQRDRVSKTLGEVREILCDALPNENQLTSFMAVKLVQERDDLRKSRAEVVGKYQAAVKEMHEAGAQRNEAREALETGGLLGILDRAGHDRAEAIRERDEARVLADRLARCLVISSWDHPKADECQSAYEAWEEARAAIRGFTTP